jgi:hypothetical protein
MTEELVAQNRKTQEAIFNIIKTENDSAVWLDRLQRAFMDGIYSMMNDDQKKAIDQQVAAANSLWFQYYLTCDPRPSLSKLNSMPFNFFHDFQTKNEL